MLWYNSWVVVVVVVVVVVITISLVIIVVFSFLFVPILPLLQLSAMSLDDSFGYVSSKNCQIWTKLGRGMGNGERVILQNFGRDRSRELQRKRQNTNLFRDEYHAPVWSLPFSVTDFRETRQEYVNQCAHESFRSEVLKIFW